MTNKLTIEMLENPGFDFISWTYGEIIKALGVSLQEVMKPIDYDFLYGEGSYERFIFGGGAGL